MLLIGVSSSEGGEGKGKLIGSVFKSDGVTPVKGAVVIIKNVSTGQEFSSSETDGRGKFEVDVVKKGFYVYGISTSEGNYNSDGLIGIHGDNTVNVMIVLNQYEAREAAATQEIHQQRKLDGAALIGRIEGFHPATLTADVFLIYGFLKKTDKIRIKGERTDFHQEIYSLSVNGVEVEKAFAGETVRIKFMNTAAVDDSVYVTCKKFGALPVFLANPFGLAMIEAGAGFLTYGILEPTEEISVSPFRPKKK